MLLPTCMAPVLCAGSGFELMGRRVLAANSRDLAEEVSGILQKAAKGPTEPQPTSS